MSTPRYYRHSTEFKVRLVQSCLASALERKVGQPTMEADISKKLRERTSPPEGTPSVISGPVVSQSSKDAKS